MKPEVDPLKSVEDSPVTVLSKFFYPEAVAVVGATERSGAVGRDVMSNLQIGYRGEIYPINPTRPSVLGVKCIKSLVDCPKVPDLAVLVTPAKTVPALVDTCCTLGVPAIVIISAGFKEVGESGQELEDQIVERVKRTKGKSRIIGPNCLGIMCPISGLNASFASKPPFKGSVALISQSGALCTSILDWTMQTNVGFSYFISIGSMCDVNWADLIDFLGQDEHTTSILIYMETVGEARDFLSAAREVSLIKPIIVLKAGRTEAAAQAAVSHTGSLAGSDDVLDMAFKRAGIVRVDTISEVFGLSDVLSKQPLPQGPNLTIITNAGGPGVLATDAVINFGGSLAQISESLLEKLNNVLPAAWSHNNPIDILGSATPDDYSKVLDCVVSDDNLDAILVILTPQSMTDPTQTAQVISTFKYKCDKPLLVCYQGGEDLEPGKHVLERAGIPCFNYADEACKMFTYMWFYRNNLNSLYQTPQIRDLDDMDAQSVFEKAGKMIREAQESGRTILSEEESKRILKTYGVPVVETIFAATEEEALKVAEEEIGYPCVIKIHSNTITHKSDIGGVKLNIITKQGVSTAFRDIKAAVAKKFDDVDKHFLGVTVQPMLRTDSYELIIGSYTDIQFGPVVVFGSGGKLVEVYGDSSLGLPPLNQHLASEMIRSTKIHKALLGFRGEEPVDIEQLEQIIVRFSRLIVEHPMIKEVDINPILAYGKRIMGVDARIVIYPKDTSIETIPRVAIRPYPTEYIFKESLRDGYEALFRPIRPEDEPKIVQLNKDVSDESVIGYFGTNVPLQERISHPQMINICFTDYSRQISLCVELIEPVKDERPIKKFAGLGRLMKVNDTTAKFAILVNDKYQGFGIGRRLVKLMMDIGKKEKYDKIYCDIVAQEVTIQLPAAQKMIKLCSGEGFELDDVGKQRKTKAVFHIQ